MSYLSEDQLRQLAQFPAGIKYKDKHALLNKETAEATVFLSHSNKDKELVEGFIIYLATESLSTIYVDYQDSEMPRITNRRTAERIKEKIEELDYFIVLATKNAMNSKWVPWEIGIADARKPTNQIAIIPIVDPSGHFYGNEYLQLYQTIEISKNNILAVFPPKQTEGIKLKSWLLPSSP